MKTQGDSARGCGTIGFCPLLLMISSTIRKMVGAAILLLVSSTAWAQYGLDYNFYFRTGLSYSRSNVDGVCYNSPGWPDISPRFGNECGNYAEMMFKKDYRPQQGDATAPWFRGQITFSVASDGNQNEENAKPENRPNGGGASGTYDFTWANREMNDKTKGDNYLTSYLRPLYKDKTSGYTFGVMADVWL